MFKPFYCCFGLFLFWIFSFKDVQPGLFFIRIFRVLHTVQSLIFKVLTLFRANAEGGIWTLAPLLTTYSLSRGAPSATWVLLLVPMPKHCFLFDLFIQRREWDSNPRALSDKRFSRPPRYDRFDISPNVLVYYIIAFGACQEVSWTFLFFFVVMSCTHQQLW